MTYSPSESEKMTTAVVQVLAAFLLFIPSAVTGQMPAYRSSPYIVYWARACMFWSVFITVLLALATGLWLFTCQAEAIIVVAVIHVVFCVTGALSSYFNTPFRYWFIANRFCLRELGNVYGQLLAPPEPDSEDEDPY